MPKLRCNVTKNQTADDFVILNFDDERLRELCQEMHFSCVLVRKSWRLSLTQDIITRTE